MPNQIVDFEAVRSIGTALPEVKAYAGGRGTALKLNGKLVACEAIHRSAEANSLMVRISPARRDALLAQDARTYYLTEHYAPYAAILVRLSRIERPSLARLLKEASEYVKSGASRNREP